LYQSSKNCVLDQDKSVLIILVCMDVSEKVDASTFRA